MSLSDALEPIVPTAVHLLSDSLLADEEETVITSLALWGEMIEITGKRNDNAHLGKWSEDSDVEKYEKAASSR